VILIAEEAIQLCLYISPWAHIFRWCIVKGARTIVQFWHNSLGKKLETILGVVSEFLPCWKLYVVVDVTFLKLINISLGFPTLGFSLANCLNF
jgi:hypothetical protein